VGRSDATRWPTWALIRRARQLAGLTQAQLAERAGTSQPAIARYEKGRVLPDLGTLHRIVEACGFELRLELAEPADQRSASEDAAIARSLEDRLSTNEAWTALAAQLRDG
jgi:transcriptional regulator with XRE-family HTH domain